MKILETIKKTKIKTVLEKGIDFTDSDLIRQYNALTISDSRLKAIAKEHGYDYCSRCNQIVNVTNQFVNAEFIIEG